MEAKIVVQNLTKRYGPVTALDRVSFSVGAGEIFGILGVNGAGKTTTLECLSGLREPDDGSIAIGGLEPRRHLRAVRAKIGVVLPVLALPEQVTAGEAVRLFATWRGDRRETRDLLGRFGLAAQADARAGQLSQGQRQRLNLALACLGEPEVMLLDEPSNGLDPQARHELQEEILRMKREGRAVVLATHLLDEAERLCDRVAILDRGRILAEGSPAELAARAGRRQRVRLEADRPVPPETWRGIPAIEDATAEGSVVTFAASSVAATLGALLPRLAERGIEVRALEARPATLEESFLRLTGTDAG
ncbi:MAG TPA: ABC transporter ATP-binding protein [Opitutaceae bacterium]|nr:ABC transporter ATP-binding protein [Opitutaceae bacterium]